MPGLAPPTEASFGKRFHHPPDPLPQVHQSESNRMEELLNQSKIRGASYLDLKKSGTPKRTTG
jgi:hypothetical protein